MSKDPFTSSESKISFDIYRYIFTGVCLSTGGGCLVPGGRLIPGGAWPRGCLLWGGVCSRGVVSAPGGVVSQHALCE